MNPGGSGGSIVKNSSVLVVRSGTTTQIWAREEIGKIRGKGRWGKERRQF